MTRLLLLIVLILPITGVAQSPLMEARANVTVTADPLCLVPIGKLPEAPFVIVTSPDDSLEVFSEYFRKYAPAKVVDFKTAEGMPLHHPMVVAARGKDSDDIERLTAERPDILAIVWFGAPAKTSSGTSAAVIKAGDTSANTQAAAAQALFGAYDIKHPVRGTVQRSRLGFAAPGDMGVSDSLQLLIDSIVSANIKARSFPGCQIVVARRGNVILDKAYGHLDYSPAAAPVTGTTLYDVASMTKVLATVPAVMKISDSGEITLDSRLAERLAALQRDGLDDLTVADFLFHRTGLPPTINTFDILLDSASYSGRLFSRSPKKPYTIKIEKNVYINSEASFYPGLFDTRPSPRNSIAVGRSLFASPRVPELIDSAIYNAPLKSRTYRYSCLNFCILKDLVEEVSEHEFSQLLAESVYRPIGAYHTCFRPLSSGSYTKDMIAPTEKDPFMRKQLLQGYVHDEIAAYSGGVQGNAGLFATALDAAKLCQTWLQEGVYGGEEIFNGATVKRFTTDCDSTSQRGLGFDLARRTAGWRDTGLSASAYGHTGFTGTCCWVDPERELVFVFLCNRICPTRDNNAFNRLSPRSAILSTIINSITDDQETKDDEEEIETGIDRP
ncbi:MAG: serine hydrolase [Muribaculaceae bacterium]|nr:serine hydrolase [Muribaculaceae bacterium]